MTTEHEHAAELAAITVDQLSELAGYCLAHQEYAAARRALSALRHGQVLQRHLAERARSEAELEA